MKSFKDFIKKVADKKDEYLPISLVFGSHSKKNEPEYKQVDLVFGSHSKNAKEKAVKEDFNLKSPMNVRMPWPHRVTSYETTLTKATSTHVNDLHDELDGHYRDTLENHEHVGSLRGYTSGSSNLNDHLIRQHRKETDPETYGHLSTDHSAAHWKPKIEGIDKVLSDHSTPRAFSVFTGVGREHPLREQLNKVKLGTEGSEPLKMHHPAYTSTSIDYNTARGFARSTDVSGTEKASNPGRYQAHLLKINIPKGHPGAYVPSVSTYDSEKEFLLPRNTKLHVKPKPIHSETLGDTTYHTWEADIHHG